MVLPTYLIIESKCCSCGNFYPRKTNFCKKKTNDPNDPNDLNDLNDLNALNDLNDMHDPNDRNDWMTKIFADR